MVENKEVVGREGGAGGRQQASARSTQAGLKAPLQAQPCPVLRNGGYAERKS